MAEASGDCTDMDLEVGGILTCKIVEWWQKRSELAIEKQIMGDLGEKGMGRGCSGFLWEGLQKGGWGEYGGNKHGLLI